MLRFSFARFSSFAFCRTLLCYSSCWLSPFLFGVIFCFDRFRIYLFLPAFECFSLWFVYLRFQSRFLCHSTFTPLHAWFFRFFCQFRDRIICLCFQGPFCSFSCVFHFWPLLLFMALGISRFCPFEPSWAARYRFVRDCLLLLVGRYLVTHFPSCFHYSRLVLSVGFRLLVWQASFGSPCV